MIKKFYVNNYLLDQHQTKLLLTNSNSLVIAGAGSGKTLTIIGKINYLIEYKNLKPHEILVISFTNASVDDLKKRINYNVQIFTFHKLALHILNLNNIKYQICSDNLLKFIIREFLYTCSNTEQKKILKFLKLDISYGLFLKSKEYLLFCNFIETFINLLKTTNFCYSNLQKLKLKKIEKEILTIIFNIYKVFITEKYSTNTFDFDDLIIFATKYVSNTDLPFKYIIIDEFQDSSFIRLNLIKEIFQLTNSKIVVVGDDWQSIYRFSGCDLSIFLNFETFFPNVKKIKLINTYRNSQELINIASNFIQKNSNQIPKKLISAKSNKQPIVFVPYLNKKEKFKQLIIELLNHTEDILILSRNTKDIYEYLDNDFIYRENYIYYKNFKFKVLTVHKSKGLEATNTIILNCNNDYLGFPNKIENNKLTQKIFPNENFKFAEERRLFYVALTRCKETTYIMYKKNNPSKFIVELKKIIKKLN